MEPLSASTGASYAQFSRPQSCANAKRLSKIGGIEVNDQSLVPGDNPRLSPTRFEDWLSQSIPQK